ncbi:MAG TPA: transcriptional regulator [Actinokineospora sp.]|jgi:DNA-binding transcriptional ArsR family regulator|nr:transcriptional regulator [Actinokineospora sp.]
MTEVVQALPHPTRDEIRIDAVLHALADPMRLHMVRELAKLGEGVACGTIELPISKSTRTHHLRILRDAGVTWTVQSGTSRITSLRRDDLDTLFPGLLTGILAAKK